MRVCRCCCGWCSAKGWNACRVAISSRRVGSSTRSNHWKWVPSRSVKCANKRIRLPSERVTSQDAAGQHVQRLWTTQWPNITWNFDHIPLRSVDIAVGDKRANESCWSDWSLCRPTSYADSIYEWTFISGIITKHKPIAQKHTHTRTHTCTLGLPDMPYYVKTLFEMSTAI